MIKYELNETLEQAIMNAVIEHETDGVSHPLQVVKIGDWNTGISVADVILSNGQRMRVRISLTITPGQSSMGIPVIDLSAGKEVQS